MEICLAVTSAGLVVLCGFKVTRRQTGKAPRRRWASEGPSHQIRRAVIVTVTVISISDLFTFVSVYFVV